MSILTKSLRRIWYLLRRSKLERELQREMEIHREMMAEPSRFGNGLRLREEARDVWGWTWLDDLAADVSYAWRVFRRNPGFTCTAIFMLAIGIGANTAMFTQVNAVMLKLLPVQHPEELEQLEWTSPKAGFAQARGGSGRRNEAGNLSEYFSYSAYLNVLDNSTTFSKVMAFNYVSLNVGIAGAATRLQGQIVSGNYFDSLGNSIFRGRPILPSDDAEGVAPVAVLGYNCWQDDFAGDPSAVGREVTINGTPFVIIGIAAQKFHGLDPSRLPDLFVPMITHPGVTGQKNTLGNNEDWTAVRVVGRVKPGVSAEQARLESEFLVRQSIVSHPPRIPYVAPQVWFSNLAQGVDDLRRNQGQSLTILMTVVGMVLVITCANLAGLMLAKASTRYREIATRLAIGASTPRLMRQLLTESLLLSSVGGVAGIAVAFGIGRIFPSPLNDETTKLAVSLAPDVRVFVFSMGLIVLTGIVVGLLPAIRAAKVDLISSMKQTTSSSSDVYSRFRTGKVLVAIQVALSLVLLVAAGVLIKTVVNLRSESFGFQVDGLLQFAADPGLNGYTNARRTVYFEQAMHQIENAPGVLSATLSQANLVGSRNSLAVCVPDHQASDNDVPFVGAFNVAPRFFETARIPLLLGRDFTWDDRANSPQVTIVNEAFARKFFSEKSPVGMRVGAPFSKPCNAKFTVAGVVANATRNLRGEPEPLIYFPFEQMGFGPMLFTVRSMDDPARLIPTVRKTMHDIDPTVPLYSMATQVQKIDQLMSRERLLTRQLAAFGLLSVLLAALGIYGTLNYLVTRRTSEIGVRMALGAQRSDVMRLVVGESSLAVGAGILVGLGIAVESVKSLRELAYQVSPTDPVTILTSTLLLIVVAAAAAFLPARRASRIDPAASLRND